MKLFIFIISGKSDSQSLKNRNSFNLHIQYTNLANTTVQSCPKATVGYFLRAHLWANCDPLYCLCGLGKCPLGVSDSATSNLLYSKIRIKKSKHFKPEITERAKM